MKDLSEIPFDKYLKFVSFDITNMYSNVPMNELIKIIELMCNQNDLNIELRCEIIKICKILTKENYFQYKDLQYIQENGPTMGAPTSSIFSGIYLKYL